MIIWGLFFHGFFQFFQWFSQHETSKFPVFSQHFLLEWVLQMLRFIQVWQSGFRNDRGESMGISCTKMLVFVCFRLFSPANIGISQPKTRLILQTMKIACYLSLSIHNCTYVHYCQGNKEQLQLKQNDDLSQTNMGTLSKRTGEMKAISKALSSCCPMRSSSSISCHNAAVFQLPGGKTWQKNRSFPKLNQHFQSFTHLLGANSRCYWEQIGTSNHTKRPWHPSAWCQSFLLFPPPFACVWTSARAHVLMSASPMDSHQGLYIDNWI